MPGRERQGFRLPPHARRHLSPRAPQDAGNLGCVTSLGKSIELRLEKDQARAVLQHLRFRVPLQSALPHQRLNALDRRPACPVGREQGTDGLRLPPRGIAPPPQVSLAARWEVFPGITPPLEMLRTDGYLESLGRCVREQS